VTTLSATRRSSKAGLAAYIEKVWMELQEARQRGPSIKEAG
jgi:hypothetical protein